MDSVIQLLSTFSALLLFIYYCYHHFFKPNPNHNRALPRAGGSLPLIGHLHLFGSNQLLHKTLGAMSDKYGPAFTVRLGCSQDTLVVSSHEMARQCFTAHDLAFSGRPAIAATRLLGYNYAMFGFAPYGPYWREIRKIATLELMSQRRIDALGGVRASEVRASLAELHDSWASARDKTGGGPFLWDIKRWFGDLTLNAMVRMVGGKRFIVGQGGERDDGARARQKLMKDFLCSFGVFVLGDVMPFLGWLDFQGHEKKMKRIAKELDDLLEEWLEEHKERRREGGEVDQDFMGVMLGILEGAGDDGVGAFDADTIIKSTCLNLILAGSDTTMVTLTWAVSLLLNNPEVLKRVQAEVDTHISKDRHVEESDIKNLVYLQAVVKETLRLYPPVPVSLRSAMEDCTISPGGYHVPSGTRLMVNAWKIQRDGSIWPEPNEFRPDRFLTSHKGTDVRGQNFELLPFGSGRRSCPGISLGLQMVHLTLASFIHCYHYANPSDAEIDMTESPGLTNLKATPLEVYLTPRVGPEVFGIVDK